MQEFDEYLALSKTGESLFKEKGSKFYGYALVCKSEDQAKNHLYEIRKLHPKNRHVCFAWRLGFDENQLRANDDGEPSGSAGKPILNVILSNNLRNVLIVVVRYFGGTLLGVPGLIIAYKSAAQEAVNEAILINMTLNDIFLACFDFAEMNEVMKILKEFDLKIRIQSYDTQCQIEFEVRRSLVEQVLARFGDLRGVEIKELEL